MAWNDNISGKHLEIAKHSGSPMRVLAGPGTGKSYSLQRKVQKLLEDGKDPKKILVVTFTNVAAEALKSDLKKVEAVGSEMVKACTLHSLCFEILKRENVFQITSRVPRPLLEFEKKILVEDLKEKFDGKKNVKKLITDYESAFAREQSDIPGNITNNLDLRFRTELLNWLNIHGAILIGELIPLTLSYLKANPVSEELYRYDYVLVDEYQDLNKVEQVLIDYISKDSELLVIGDDDQSIYGFKNAHPEGIIEFPDTHINTSVVSLQVCRRCPKKIVKLANELMNYEVANQFKKLEEFDDNPDGEVYATQWSSLNEETKGVAKIIHSIVTSERKISAEDILVLSPRRQLGYAIRDELKNTYGIRSHTYFQEDALDNEKVVESFALLSYLANPEDKVALRAVLGLPTSLSLTYEKIFVKAEELNISPKEVLEGLASGSLNLARTNEIVDRFKKLQTSVSEFSNKTIKELIELIFQREDKENYDTIFSIIDSIELTENMTANVFFKKLQSKILYPEISQEKDYVRIMSLHKSKGLTSKAVFIIGCVSGLLPSIKDEEKLRREGRITEIDKLEKEARRLFFVGITRAKELLFISSFKNIDYRSAKILKVKTVNGISPGVLSTQSSTLLSMIPISLGEVNTSETIFTKLNIT